jgi:hypothetical protein
LTMIGLFFLGGMVRGPTTGIVLAYLWAAYPFTLFALASNSNDSLVALMIVLALLVVRWAPARGVAAAWAGLTKFTPLALGPLFLRGTGPEPTRKQVATYIGAYGLALLAAMAYVLLDGNFSVFWRDTITYQTGRVAPFSIWGLWGGAFSDANSLSAPHALVEGATIALAIGVMFVPRKRGMVELCALGGAVMVAIQLCLTYWFYLYIPWFFPLVIVALIVSHPPREGILPESVAVPQGLVLAAP